MTGSNGGCKHNALKKLVNRGGVRDAWHIVFTAEGERKKMKEKNNNTCCFLRSSTISGRHAEGCLLHLACD